MENILEKPLVRTYQYNAFAESILGIHKNYQEWLASNYIQIMVCEDFANSLNVIEYLAGSILGCCPLLERETDIKAEVLFSCKSCTEYLDNIFQQKLYIYTFVDEYYIPNRVSYQKSHFEHDILLYGREQDDFVYIGYDALGNYSKGKLSAEQLYQGLQTSNQCFLKVWLNDNSYKFDIQKFIFMLKQYLNSEDSRKNLDVYLDMSRYSPAFYDAKLNKQLGFGMKSYILLKRLFEFYDETDAPYDWRVLHLLYEHKEAMRQKIQYLIDKNYLSDGEPVMMKYGDIVAKAKLIENMGLKYQITRAKHMNRAIRDKILDLQKEEEILNLLLEALIRQNGF